MNKKVFVKVALPLPFFEQFLYSVPTSLVDKVEIGKRVLVPFRNSGYTGIIVEKEDNYSEILDFSIKDIEDIPDDFCLFTKKEINIAKKLSDYYIAPLGLTLFSFIPAGLKWKKEKGKWKKFEYENKVYKVMDENISKLTKNQKKLIEFIKSCELPTEEEIIQAGFSKQTLNSLIKKKVLKSENIEFYNSLKPTFDENLHNLNTEGICLKNDLYLLSGKTADERFRYYLSLLCKLNKNKESALIVFPNIKSINYFYQKLSKYFSNLYVYFEGVPQKNLIQIIKKLQKENGILITTYSGMLIPVKNLKVVIVEEEYANSYKTKKTPKMDIRRIAYELHKEKNIPVIYSGYLPSIESYFLYTQRKIKTINKNFLDIKLSAKIKIYPYDKEKVFSNLLKNLITEDTLILANKKAYASFLYCKRCDEEILCNNCDVPLKVYKKNNLILKCEICKEKFEYINKCPKCEAQLQEVGTGIEKVEEILSYMYSSENVSRLEEEKKTPIKITTTITNLEFYPNSFKTIINLFPDFSLFSPDYKGRENFFKNIVIPITKSKENYYLITNQQEDISVKSLLGKNLENFYKFELKIRKKLKLPPYSKFILVTFEKKNLNLQFLKELFEIWTKANNIENFDYKGILKGYISKKKNKNIAQVLLVDFKEKKLLKDLYEKAQKMGIKVNIDVNPASII